MRDRQFYCILLKLKSIVSEEIEFYCILILKIQLYLMMYDVIYGFKYVDYVVFNNFNKLIRQFVLFGCIDYDYIINNDQILNFLYLLF